MAFPNEKQKIYMVTGKGGVGKSTVAAAIAKKEARNGQKTLLVEMGELSYYQYVLGRPLSYEPKEIEPNLSVALWSGTTSLREYVYYLVRVKKIVELFFDNRIMQTFIKAAPALKELAILGKITSGIRGWGPPLPYDVIVVDAFASGHFMALLRAPIGMSDLIESGPMGEQSRKIHEVLCHPKLCEYILVTTAEELPITEAIELSHDLEKWVRQKPTVVCNRIYEGALSVGELDDILQKGGSGGKEQFVEFLKNLQTRQSTQLDILTKNIGKFIRLPLVLQPDGRDVIAEIEGHWP